MEVDWKYIQAYLLSIVLHTVLAVLLLVSVDTSLRKVPVVPEKVNIVNAVSVDQKQVDEELKRLKAIDEKKKSEETKKQKELEKKLKELQKKSQDAEKKRKAEEKRLADLKKKKSEEQKKREQEEKKLEQLKKEQELLEKKKKEDEQRRKKEEQDRKALEEKKKKEEAERKKREQEEQRRREEEARMQKELAEEQARLEAEQRSRDQQLLQNIVVNIKRSIISNFNKSGLPPGLECVLSVRLVPGGEVVSVTISKSSGNDVFDRRALVAVQKASPLPIPEDVATFERLRLRQFAFRFKPEE